MLFKRSQNIINQNKIKLTENITMTSQLYMFNQAVRQLNKVEKQRSHSTRRNNSKQLVSAGAKIMSEKPSLMQLPCTPSTACSSSASIGMDSNFLSPSDSMSSIGPAPKIMRGHVTPSEFVLVLRSEEEEKDIQLRESREMDLDKLFKQVNHRHERSSFRARSASHRALITIKDMDEEKDAIQDMISCHDSADTAINTAVEQHEGYRKYIADDNLSHRSKQVCLNVLA